MPEFQAGFEDVLLTAECLQYVGSTESTGFEPLLAPSVLHQLISTEVVGSHCWQSYLKQGPPAIWCLMKPSQGSSENLCRQGNLGTRQGPGNSGTLKIRTATACYTHWYLQPSNWRTCWPQFPSSAPSLRPGAPLVKPKMARVPEICFPLNIFLIVLVPWPDCTVNISLSTNYMW